MDFEPGDPLFYLTPNGRVPGFYGGVRDDGTVCLFLRIGDELQRYVIADPWERLTQRSEARCK